MRRTVAVIAMLALATLMPQGPVQGVESWHGTVRGAVAEWWATDGDALTGVMIEVADRIEHTPQGAAVHTRGLNLQVIQQETDRVTGEPVYRQLWTEPYYAPMSSLEIHTLRSASAGGTVSLVGMEWVGEEQRAIGPFTVNVSARWQVSGAVTRDRSSTWDTQFGAKVRDGVAIRSAPAAAWARVGGLSIGTLGTTTGELVAVRIASHVQPAQEPSMQVAPAFRAAWRLPGLTDATTTAGTEHRTGAFGAWQVDGDEGTGVLLDVGRPHGRSDSGSEPSGTLEIYGTFCDEATDELVSYDVFSGPIDFTVVRIPSSLAGATVDLTATMSGYESRTAGCEHPTGDPVDGEGGPYLVTLHAAWVGTGPIQHVRASRWVRGPEYALRSLELNRGRQASASGTIDSVLLSGSLGAPENAFLYDLRTRLAVRGEPPE